MPSTRYFDQCMSSRLAKDGGESVGHLKPPSVQAVVCLRFGGGGGAAIAQLIEVLGRGEGERNQRKAVRGQEDRCFTVIRELPSRLTAPGGRQIYPIHF